MSCGKPAVSGALASHSALNSILAEDWHLVEPIAALMTCGLVLGNANRGNKSHYVGQAHKTPWLLILPFPPKSIICTIYLVSSDLNGSVCTRIPVGVNIHISSPCIYASYITYIYIYNEYSKHVQPLKLRAYGPPSQLPKTAPISLVPLTDTSRPGLRGSRVSCQLQRM